LYGITDHPEFGLIIKNFLKNIELGLFQGKTSIIVLNELLHKLVIGEIAEKYRLKLFQVPAIIKQDPTILSNLKSYELVNKIESIMLNPAIGGASPGSGVAPQRRLC